MDQSEHRGISYAGVVEWQTRLTQNQVSKRCASSSLATGTINYKKQEAVGPPVFIFFSLEKFLIIGIVIGRGIRRLDSFPSILLFVAFGLSYFAITIHLGNSFNFTVIHKNKK